MIGECWLLGICCFVCVFAGVLVGFRTFGACGGRWVLIVLGLLIVCVVLFWCRFCWVLTLPVVGVLVWCWGCFRFC